MRHDSTRRPGAGGMCHPRGHRGGVGGWADTGGYRTQPVQGTCLPPLPQGTQASSQTGRRGTHTLPGLTCPWMVAGEAG